MDFDDEQNEGSLLPGRSPVSCIIDAAWSAALTPDISQALASDDQKIVIVTVPDQEWVRALDFRVKRLLGIGWATFARDGSHRSRDKSEVGSDDVVIKLTGGQNVVGIAVAVSILPAALVAAADIRIEIRRPDARVVGQAIAKFLGRRTPYRCSADPGSLDLFSLAACFRKGTARAIDERISRAQAGSIEGRGETAPALSTAIEYGAARDWGLAVVQDMASYHAGTLPWSAVESSVLIASGPGIGKTTFARSLSNAIPNCTLVATSISELFAGSPGYLDSVIKAMRETYARAEMSVPAVILWDEIDALPSRVGLDSRSASWWTSVITDFMMMVAVPRPGVIQIAATNFADRVDPALRRPGRFGRTIELEPPGPLGVESMARHQLAGDLAGADLALFGQVAEGSTAAEVMQIVRRARGTARTAGRDLQLDDLIDAVTPPLDVTPEDARRITIHEAGHAVVSVALGVDELVGLQIGGSGLGSTKHKHGNELDTRQSIENRVVMTLAGRAAELVCIGDISSGSNRDLVNAVRAVSAVHAALGLGDRLYAVTEDELEREMTLDPVLRGVVEQDLQRLHERAIDVVRTHRFAVEKVAAALAERRHLTGDQTRAIFQECLPSLECVTEAPEC